MLFPARLADITNFGLDGSGQRLQIVPAQFRSSGLNSNEEVVGSERRFDRVGVSVFYAPIDTTTDITAPVLADPKATITEGTTEFSITASDDESDIRQVTVLYRRNGSDNFDLLNLVPDPSDAGRWFAGVQLDDAVEFMFQAVNEEALVGSISNHGYLFTEVEEIETDPDGLLDRVIITTDIPPTNGIYNGDVVVTFTSELGYPVSVIDSATDDEVNNPLTVTGDGLHTFATRRPDPRSTASSAVSWRVQRAHRHHRSGRWRRDTRRRHAELREESSRSRGLQL